MGNLTGIKTQLVQHLQKIDIENIKITTVPAYNINKPYHTKVKQGLGFIAETSLEKIYHCSDTDFICEMGNIECDIALLAVSGTYVMTAKEAAKVINSKIAKPMDYGEIVGSINDALEFCGLLKNTKIETLFL